MLEDGEISNSPKSAAPAADDDDDDGFVVDRSFLEVIENSEDVADDDAAANVTGDSEAVKDISMASSLSGTPSEWAKKMRKRLLEESEPRSPSTEPEPVSKRPRRQNLCFNCREEHSIADCPHPKNFAEIRKNKQEFQALQQGNTGGARISKETAGGAAKESKFKAGKISIALRDALGLGSDDLPEWIYRMRRMGFRKGYPPGYLRESLKHEYGTLKIFSGDSKEEEMEEQSCPMPIVQESKIVTYLGFNKSYGALNDREKGMFSIPPMKEFVEMLQEDAKSRHEWEESRRRCDLERLKRQEAAEKDSEDVADDSVIVVEEVKEESVVILETSEDVVVAVEGTEKLGESIHQLIGTPIISRRDASGVWIPHTTPTLEAFAVGIVPFEAKEEEKPRGIFKKIMATLRGEESKSDDDK